MLREKVINTIKKYRMVESGDKIVLGVSGGPDSVALAYILASLQGEFRLSLFIAHLNHMFRPVEAEKEVRFVREMGNRLGLPVFVRHENVPAYVQENKVSPEAGAREIRYAFLKEIAAKTGAKKIALGHTMDDQAETLLLNLLRGSGHTGLGAIMPVNESFIRPLIECSKEEILAYLDQNKLSYCVDSSNLEPLYQRNKIRLELLPLLAKDYNPNIRETLFRTSLILQQEDLYLESQAQRHTGHTLKSGRRGEVILNLKEFEKVPAALKPRILREAIKRVKGNLLQLNFIHISDMLDLIQNKPTGSSLNLPEITVYKDYGRLRFFKGKAPGIEMQFGSPEEEAEYVIKKSVLERDRPLSFYRATHDTAYFDFEKISGPLYVRTRKSGDRFFPQGARGHKKLSDFFIDQKVPREMRDKIPLLVNRGKIIWVVGYRVSEEAKVSFRTRKILKVEVFRKAE